MSKGFPVRLQFSLKALLLLMAVAAVGVAHFSNRPIELESSSIDTVQYNQWTKTLEVRFQSGDCYRYFEVPREKYRGLLEAESHGEYFYAEVREKDFKFEKVKKD